jgi:hypothetical protein
MPNMTPEIRALYRNALKRLKDAGQEAKPLYHFSTDIEGLIKKPETNRGYNESWKPEALYASDNLADNQGSRVGDPGTIRTLVDELKHPDGSMRKQGYVRIVPKPDASVSVLAEPDLIARQQKIKDEAGLLNWQEKLTNQPEIIRKRMAANQIHLDSLPQTDLMKLTGVDGNAELTEYLIRNPDKVSIFASDKAWNPAIAATAGAGTIAGAVLGTPTDSEAFPLGKLTKFNSKTIEKFSRTLDPYNALKNRNLNLALGEEGARTPHTIVDVLRKGVKGDDRMLLLKDTVSGEYRQLPLTKDYLNVLLGADGTQKYLTQFENSAFSPRKSQAVKSLALRQEKRDNGPITNQKDFASFNTMQAEKAREIDPTLVNDYVYFKPTASEQQVYVPRPYADLLSSKGYGEITSPGPNPSGVLTPKRQALDAPKRAYTSRVADEDLMKNYRANLAKEGKVPRPITDVLNETTPEEQQAVREHLSKHYLTVGKAPADIAEYMHDYTKILREIIRRRD